MSDTRLYRTTGLAGLHVAGRRLQFTVDKETGQPESVVGQELRLTEAEAKYELQNGVIEPVEEPAGKAAAKAAAAAGKSAS